MSGSADPMVNHPAHYNQHPKGIECIDVIEDFASPNIAFVFKHLWRAGLKPGADLVQDLEKAAWYLSREIDRVKASPAPPATSSFKPPLPKGLGQPGGARALPDGGWIALSPSMDLPPDPDPLGDFSICDARLGDLPCTGEIDSWHVSVMGTHVVAVWREPNGGRP